jgi:hypothetical protein
MMTQDVCKNVAWSDHPVAVYLPVEPGGPRLYSMSRQQSSEIIVAGD